MVSDINCTLSNRTILQKKLKATESRADLVRDLRALIGRTPGLSCDGLSDEYVLEILDWAARDRIDKIAGWGEFTQPSLNLLAEKCIYVNIFSAELLEG